MKKILTIFFAFALMIGCINYKNIDVHAAGSQTVIYKQSTYVNIYPDRVTTTYNYENGKPSGYTSDPMSNSFQVVQKTDLGISYVPNPVAPGTTLVTHIWKFTITDRM